MSDDFPMDFNFGGGPDFGDDPFNFSFGDVNPLLSPLQDESLALPASPPQDESLALPASPPPRTGGKRPDARPPSQEETALAPPPPRGQRKASTAAKKSNAWSDVNLRRATLSHPNMQYPEAIQETRGSLAYDSEASQKIWETHILPMCLTAEVPSQQQLQFFRDIQERLAFGENSVLVEIGSRSQYNTFKPDAHSVWGQVVLHDAVLKDPDRAGHVSFRFTLDGEILAQVKQNGELIVRINIVPYHPLYKVYKVAYATFSTSEISRASQNFNVLLPNENLIDAAVMETFYHSRELFPTYSDALANDNHFTPEQIAHERYLDSIRTNVFNPLFASIGARDPTNVRQLTKSTGKQLPLSRKEALLCQYLPLAIGARFMDLASKQASTLRFDTPFVYVPDAKGGGSWKSHLSLDDSRLETDFTVLREAWRETSDNDYVYGVSYPHGYIRNLEEGIRADDAVHDTVALFLQNRLFANKIIESPTYWSTQSLTPPYVNVTKDLEQLALRYTFLGLALARNGILAREHPRFMPLGAWRHVFDEHDNDRPGGPFRDVASELLWKQEYFMRSIRHYQEGTGRYHSERYLRWPVGAYAFGDMVRDTTGGKLPWLVTRPRHETVLLNSTEERLPFPTLKESSYQLVRIIGIVAANWASESRSALYEAFYMNSNKKNDYPPSSYRMWYRMSQPERTIFNKEDARSSLRASTITKETLRTMLQEQRVVVHGFERDVIKLRHARPVGDFNLTSSTHPNKVKSWEMSPTPFDGVLSLFHAQDDKALGWDQPKEYAREIQARANALRRLLRYLWFHWQAQSAKTAEVIEREITDILHQELGDFPSQEAQNRLFGDLMYRLNLYKISSFSNEPDRQLVLGLCRVLTSLLFRTCLFAVPSGLSVDLTSEKGLQILSDNFDTRLSAFPERDEELGELFKSVLVWLYSQPTKPGITNALDAYYQYEGFMLPEATGRANDALVQIRTTKMVELGDRTKFPVKLILAGNKEPSPLYDDLNPSNDTQNYYHEALEGRGHAPIRVRNGKKLSNFSRFPYSGFNVFQAKGQIEAYSLPSAFLDFSVTLRQPSVNFAQGSGHLEYAKGTAVAVILGSQHRLSELIQSAYLYKSYIPPREQEDDIDPLHWNMPELYAGEHLDPLVVNLLRRFLYYGKIQTSTVIDVYHILAVKLESESSARSRTLSALRILFSLGLLFGNGEHINLITHSLLTNLFALSLTFDDLYSDVERIKLHTNGSIFALYDALFGMTHERPPEISFERANEKAYVFDEQELNQDSTPLTPEHLSYFAPGDENTPLMYKQTLEEQIRKLFDTNRAPFVIEGPNENDKVRQKNVQIVAQANPRDEALRTRSIPHLTCADINRGVGFGEYFLMKTISSLRSDMGRQYNYASQTGTPSVNQVLDANHWARIDGYTVVEFSDQSDDTSRIEGMEFAAAPPLSPGFQEEITDAPVPTTLRGALIKATYENYYIDAILNRNQTVVAADEQAKQAVKFSFGERAVEEVGLGEFRVYLFALDARIARHSNKERSALELPVNPEPEDFDEANMPLPLGPEWESLSFFAPEFKYDYGILQGVFEFFYHLAEEHVGFPTKLERAAKRALVNKFLVKPSPDDLDLAKFRAPTRRLVHIGDEPRRSQLPDDAWAFLHLWDR